MAPQLATASVELDYPLFAVEFDSDDPNRLVVSGGGGAGRSGVGNKITVLETSTQEELRTAGEIELSRDEDSVMSLAIGAKKGKTTYLYAGVNSSQDSITKGKNEHLRTLAVEQTKSRTSAGTIVAKTPTAKLAEISRTAMFTDPEEGTYQRLLRLTASKTMGAAATAMGKESQLAIFEADGANVKSRGVLELAKEAEDLDIMQTGESEYQVAYCYKYELHVFNIGGEDTEPHLVYTMPEENLVRPMFRCIRYLAPGFILAVSNLPKRQGAIIQGLRLPKAGQPNARLACSASLRRAISVTALAVTNLTPSWSTAGNLNETQFAIAVAGHDSSISLYTVDLEKSDALIVLHRLHPFHTIISAHGTDNITGLAFSTFVQPKTHLRPQFIKLASISLQKCVSVHSIPLKRHIDKTQRNKKGPPRPERYVIGMKPQLESKRPVLIALTIFVLIMALGGQLVLEMLGQREPRLSPQRWLPSWHGTLRTPDHQPEFFAEQKREALAELPDFLSNIVETVPAAGETLVMMEHAVENAVDEGVKTIKVDVHDEEVHGEAKKWEDLAEEQKHAWREKLTEAGHWTKGMGENVFKGVLFGELAGAVGRAVGG